MKIYLFNPETGVYLGEDFADEAPMRRGAFVVPPDATHIAPPATGHGERLVFNVAEQRWYIRQRPKTRGEWVMNMPSLLLLLVTLFSLPATLTVIENMLFFNDKTRMLFGDAKSTLQNLVSEVKSL